MKQLKQKVTTLIEALPYIRKYYGKIVVMKFGGKAMVKHGLIKNVMMDIVLLKHVGITPIIVHGGGPEIDVAMKLVGLEPKFIDGLRITDKQTIDIVEEVFENINKEICSVIKKIGGKPISVSGRDHKLILVTQKDPMLGYVGEIKKICPEILHSLIKEDYIPVISPIGVGKDNSSYNINADTAASALAVALHAEKLTILTDVEGVLERGKLISHLTIRKAKKKIRAKIINKGMIPKVEACIYAVKHGCPKAHLINGTVKHSILLEIFTDKGIGTEIAKNGNGN
ncbi:MAG: acetylglutamate kinase [Nanoarchaeota archaeon]